MQTVSFATVPLSSSPGSAHPCMCLSLSQLRLKAPCAIIRSQGKPLCSASAVPCLLPRLYLIHLETTFIFSLGSSPALPSHTHAPLEASEHTCSTFADVVKPLTESHQCRLPLYVPKEVQTPLYVLSLSPSIWHIISPS